MEEVRKYYNRHAREEDERLKYHAFELPITLHMLRKHVRPDRFVLDTACGTGHYAEALLKEGYRVALNDLSEENIKLTKERTRGMENRIACHRSNIMKSNIWELKRWDAILLLGPMYHLPDKKDRLKLLRKAYTHLKPGGFLFTGFMSRIMAVVYGLKHNPEGLLKNEGTHQLWETGHDRNFIEGTEAFTHAYFSRPDEINPLIKQAGLKPVELIGLEGIFGERFEEYHQMNEKLKKAWFRFVFRHCREPEMLYHSKHLLSVATK